MLTGMTSTLPRSTCTVTDSGNNIATRNGSIFGYLQMTMLDVLMRPKGAVKCDVVFMLSYWLGRLRPLKS